MTLEEFLDVYARSTDVKTKINTTDDCYDYDSDDTDDLLDMTVEEVYVSSESVEIYLVD